MKIEVDRSLKTPVYLQIAGQIRRQIESGEIPAGQRLPSERKLAEHLGVNRTTVLNAYGELKSEGLLDGRVGNGTIVLDRRRNRGVRGYRKTGFAGLEPDIKPICRPV